MLGERVPARAGAGVGARRPRGARRRRSPPRSTRSPSGSPRARRAPTPATKAQLNAALYAGLDEQLELEASLQQEMAGSADFAEGVAAFLEKRDAAVRRASEQSRPDQCNTLRCADGPAAASMTPAPSRRSRPPSLALLADRGARVARG